MAATEATSATPLGAPRRARWRRALLATMAFLTVAALLWQARNALHDLRANPRALAPAWEWLAAAAGLYLIGWTLQAGPWLLAAPRFGIAAPRGRSWATYLASHLAKYVPGKVGVPATRALLLPATGNAKEHLGRVVAATVHETATTMAAGSLLAVFALTVWRPDAPGGVLLAVVALAAGFTAITLPPMFDIVLALLADRTGWRATPPGWGRCLAGLASALAAWLLIAASYVCAIKAVGPEIPAADAAKAAALAAPLGTVGGFLSMLPGQAGAREWIAAAALTKPFGAYVAIAAAAWHRAATLAVEGLVGGGLWLALRRTERRP